MSTQTVQSAVRAAKAHPELAVTANDTMNAIFKRSTTDAAFRIKLISDPSDALREFAGHEIPSVNVRFVEKQGDLTLVLPPVLDAAAELSDAELETVAGGVTPVILVASSAECVASAIAVSVAIIRWFD